MHGIVWSGDDEIQAEEGRETTVKYYEWLAGRNKKVWDELVQKPREELDNDLREA